MATSKVRVVGGGNTFVTIAANRGTDEDIQLVADFNDRPGEAVSPPTPIHPVGYEHPMEIVTAYAQGAGTITLNVWAVWGKDGWADPFAELWRAIDETRAYVNKDNFSEGVPTNLMGVLQAQRANGSFTVKKWELAANGRDVARVRVYENCVITNIDASESVSNDAMAAKVMVTIMYTHSIISKTNEQRRFSPAY